MFFSLLKRSAYKKNFEVLLPWLPLLAILGELLAPSESDWQHRKRSRRFRQAEVAAVASVAQMFFTLVIVLWCAWPGSWKRNKAIKDVSLGGW